MKKLIDYRHVNNVDLSMTESESFAQVKAELSDSFSGEKCAIVAPKDVTFGTARIHDSLIEMKEPNIETEVFREFDQALDWLDVVLDQ